MSDGSGAAGAAGAKPVAADRSVRSRRVLTGALWGGAGVVIAGAALIAGMMFLADPQGRISIKEPRDGAVVDTPEITIRGSSSPDWAGVYRVLENGREESVTVDEEGGWQYRATLTPGENRFKFHLGSHYAQSDSITVLYQPRGR